MPNSKPLGSRKLQALSSIDNNLGSRQHTSFREYEFPPKGHQPNNHKNQQFLFLDDRLQKENRPPLDSPQPFNQTSSHSHYRHAGYPMNRSIDTNNNRKQAQRQHSTTGGKTISASLMKKVSQTCRGGNNGTSNMMNSNNNNNNNNNNIPVDRSPTHLRPIKQKQRTEQRMSPEQLKLLSRRIDTSLPASPHGSPSKPILPSIFSNDTSNPSHRHSSRRTSSSLYQTCIDLWPSEPTLGDLASDNIKNLTNLLKVRLSQAKYRVLAELEDDHKHTDPSLLSAAHILGDDAIDYSTWPTFKIHKIELSNKRSCGSSSVSGNGTRLFRQSHHQHRGWASGSNTTMKNDHHIYLPDKHGYVSLPPPSPSNHSKTDLKKKRKSKQAEKVLRKDGRDQASKISPLKLEDGSMAFVCTPCNKKYKTRNGLAYHLDRCAHLPLPPFIETTNDTISNSHRENSNSQSPGSKSSGVHCVCDHPTDDEEMMVKCDECQQWLHLDCVGTNDGVLDDIYHCPRCIAGDHPANKRQRLSATPETQQQQRSIASLIFQQLDNTTSSPHPDSSTSNHLLPLSLDSTTKSSSSQPSLWGNLDLLDDNNNTAPSSSTGPGITSSETQSLVTSNNEDASNIWGLSSPDIPSLLYSDPTGLPSTIDDDYLQSMMDLPSSELSPDDLPPTDWFQFANFDDDFHCDDSQPIQ